MDFYQLCEDGVIGYLFYGFDTVLFIRLQIWLLSYMVLSLAHTNLFVSEGLFLYAIATKGFGEVFTKDFAFSD